MSKRKETAADEETGRRRKSERKKKRSTRKGVAYPRPFTVRKSDVQGKGGFALRWIDKGERIVEYVGERITPAEADARYDDDSARRHHTFLFSVNKKTVIDAAVDGNAARFINHSCDPNCEAVNRKGRIYIEAIRDIAPGEELFYDYNFELDEPLTPKLKKQYPCHCGSQDCRGTILVETDAGKKKRKKKRKKQKRDQRTAAGGKGGRKPGKKPGRKAGGKSGRKAKKKTGKKAGKTSGRKAGRTSGKKAGRASRK